MYLLVRISYIYRVCGLLGQWCRVFPFLLFFAAPVYTCNIMIHLLLLSFSLF
jgi:hypothetical protein